MTQPVSPYELDAVGQSGPYGATVFRPPPQPGATPGQGDAGDVPRIDWKAIQDAERTATADGSEAARLDALREKHGSLKSAGDQFFRGVFDAILTPGALLGAGAESAGTALGIEALRDFGRDLGKAATGTSAAELLNELAGGRVGDVRRDFAEEEEARPLLATISRGAGMLGTGLAAGAGAAGGGLRAAATVGAVEGAGAGAQSAYEQDATLQDVLASTAIGGVLGAALPAGVAGAAKGYGAAKRVLTKSSDKALTESLKDAMGKYSQNNVVSALGAQMQDLRKLGRDANIAEREMRRMADDVLEGTLEDGTPIFQATQSQEKLAGRVMQAKEEAGARLSEFRRGVNDFIETQAPQLRARPTEIAAQIENDVVRPLMRSKLNANDAARVQVVADELRAMGPNVSLEELGAYRKTLKDHVYPKKTTPGLPPQVPESALELQKAERLIEGAIQRHTDDAVALMGGDAPNAYQALKSKYQSFKRASDIAGRAELAALGRNTFSPSDKLFGAVALGADLMGGGGAFSVLHGAVAAGVSKFAREHAPHVMAVLTNRLARTAKPAISVAAVGGREAQEAIQTLAQVRNFWRETGEAAGDNPSVQQHARELAKDTIAARYAREAEGFDVARWAERAPKPMQKVLFRPQLLDTASQDMASTAERIAAMRPELPPTLDVARLGKLMKEADRPAAIGALQNSLATLADSVPHTVGGADLGRILRTAADKLETAEAADAMQIGHAMRLELARAKQAIGLTPTETASFDQAFTERADSELRAALSSDSFGEAGSHYAAATNISDAHQKLADPIALREALRTLDSRGTLPAAMHDANDGILRAYEARAALTGEKMPAGLVQELRKAEELFAAGEEASTLDGRSIKRIFEHLDDTKPAPADPQRAVWDAIAPEIDKLVPVIKSEAGQSTRGRYRPSLSSTAAREATEREPLLPEEQRIEYDERLDQVADLMSDPRNMENLGVEPAIAPVVGNKLSQFLQDVPKPKQDIRGKAFETMSSDDLRLAAAMFEATVRPLSVLSDFRAGMVDYDKVQYAWKQWPGLQVAVQAGILDVLQQDLDDEERAGLSDTMLTQLDYLAGFGGRLQSSLDPAFSARIDSLNTPPEQAKPPSGGAALSSPKAEPTFTQRVAGAQT